jgi:hypothetical protein
MKKVFVYSLCFLVIARLTAQVNLAGLDKYSTMLQHYNTLQQQNKTWDELKNNVQLKTDITTLASDSLATGFANARSVLAMVSGAKNYDLIENIFASRSLITPIQNSSDSAISNLNGGIKLNAYPNPFKDELNVTISIAQSIDANTHVQLIEPVTGRILQEKLITSNYSTLQFNTENLSSGMYLIGVRGNTISPTFIKIINIR